MRDSKAGKYIIDRLIHDSVYQFFLYQFFACFLYSNLDCLHYIINLSCDANLRDSIGRTPLHYAAANSCLSFVRMLVETDADVSIADIRGCTALHFAASSDDDGRSVRVFVKYISLSQFAVCDDCFVLKMNWFKY